jgi:hypothetical protein
MIIHGFALWKFAKPVNEHHLQVFPTHASFIQYHFTRTFLKMLRHLTASILLVLWPQYSIHKNTSETAFLKGHDLEPESARFLPNSDLEKHFSLGLGNQECRLF